MAPARHENVSGTGYVSLFVAMYYLSHCNWPVGPPRMFAKAQLPQQIRETLLYHTQGACHSGAITSAIVEWLHLHIYPATTSRIWKDIHLHRVLGLSLLSLNASYRNLLCYSPCNLIHGKLLHSPKNNNHRCNGVVLPHHELSHCLCKQNAI